MSNVDICFAILKEIKREIGDWYAEGALDEIKERNVYAIIKSLRLFLEIKADADNTTDLMKFGEGILK